MVDFHFHNRLELHRVVWGDQHELMQPTYSQLAACLDVVRQGNSVNHCVECAVRLFGEIDGQLYLMRVNDIDEGHFLGWVAHLSSNLEFNSFLLANTTPANQDGRQSSTLVEMLGCHESVDTRCLLTHATLLNWIRHELMGSMGTKQYRWIEFEMALRAF